MTEYTKEVISNFNEFRNKHEHIYKKDDWTGTTSDNAIFIIWAEYIPYKYEMKHVNINYDYCPVGSVSFNQWLIKFAFKMEWIEPGVVGIYPALKPTIYKKQSLPNMSPKTNQQINDYKKAIVSNDFSNDDKKYINKHLVKLRQKYGYSLPSEIIKLIKSYLLRYTPDVFLIKYNEINARVSFTLNIARLTASLNKFTTVFVREPFFIKYLKSSENDRYDKVYSETYTVTNKKLGCLTLIYIFDETELQFSCMFLITPDHGGKYFTSIKRNINKYSIMAADIYFMINETLEYSGRASSSKIIKHIPAQYINEVSKIILNNK